MISLNKISLQPLTAGCLESLEKKEHICLGISPFNSLFSEDYISQLIAYAQRHFHSFHIFLPDEPTFYTLEALGYSPAECRKKMKKQLNWLRNKIIKALAANGFTHPESYILDWQTLSHNPSFLHELEEVHRLFDHDPIFRQNCLQASRWVLQNKMPEDEITETNLLSAVRYFLAEIPLFAATNKIVQTEQSLFCYHQAIDFHHELYQNQLIYKKADGQGYGVIQL
jgi:cyclo(L-tyrosyl-L-tyrosyl) synthase